MMGQLIALENIFSCLIGLVGVILFGLSLRFGVFVFCFSLSFVLDCVGIFKGRAACLMTAPSPNIWTHPVSVHQLSGLI